MGLKLLVVQVVMILVWRLGLGLVEEEVVDRGCWWLPFPVASGFGLCKWSLVHRRIGPLPLGIA